MKAIGFRCNTFKHLFVAYTLVKKLFLRKYSAKEIADAIKSAIYKKPCHCNKIFLRKTKLALQLNHFIPRCKYYNPYFAFRRTGTHPPLNY